MNNLIKGKRILLIALVASVTLLLGTRYYLHKQNSVLEKALTEQDLHIQQQIETRNIVSLIARIESVLRGYVISGNKKFVVPFNPNIDSIQASISRFKIANNQVSSSIDIPTFTSFERSIINKVNFMQKVKGLCDENNFKQAAFLITTGKGQQLTDSLLYFNEILLTHIAEHLGGEKVKFSKGYKIKSFIDGVAFYASILILILTFIFLGKEINKAVKIKKDLNEHDEQFGETLNSVDDGVIAADTKGLITYMNRSGLGLYIVKETLNKMQGTISVDSVKNKGTIFKLEIPNTNPI